MANVKKGIRLDHISKIYQDPKTKKIGPRSSRAIYKNLSDQVGAGNTASHLLEVGQCAFALLLFVG